MYSLRARAAELLHDIVVPRTHTLSMQRMTCPLQPCCAILTVMPWLCCSLGPHSC